MHCIFLGTKAILCVGVLHNLHEKSFPGCCRGMTWQHTVSTTNPVPQIQGRSSTVYEIYSFTFLSEIQHVELPWFT